MSFQFLKVFEYDYAYAAYLDSGAPPTSVHYTTWVMCHGAGFNGVVFEKLLPLAHAHNRRIVSFNRRGYPPSSGFQEDELKDIGHGTKFEELESVFHAQGAEIATFLVNFATEQGIPLANTNSPTGGIVFICWSFGMMHSLSLLAYVDKLRRDIRSTLQKYLHTILFHDANSKMLGIPQPKEQDTSMWSEIDDRKLFDAFFDWVTAHYIHKSITSENIADLEFNHPSNSPHSMCELSYEQRARYTHLEAFTDTGCDRRFYYCDTTAFAALTKRALFDKARAEMFPDVRVRFMVGGTSTGGLIFPVWMLRKYMKDSDLGLYGKDAETSRDIKTIIQAEGNHFIFWEDPEKAIQHYNASINL